MNKVTLPAPAPVRSPKEGDLYRHLNDGKVYILAKVDYFPRYCAIGLDDGNRWDNPRETLQQAVNGLIFVKRNATISIK